MADLEEQRRKVEELKKKILEQKSKGTAGHVVGETQQPQTMVSPKIIPPTPPVPPNKNKEEKPRAAEVPPSVEPAAQPQPVKEEKKDAVHDAVPMQQRATAMIALQAYAQALKQAWTDGAVTKDEEDLLLMLRRTLGISDEEHQGLEQELQVEVYLQALTNAWQTGGISTEDSERLDSLRSRFHISADEHFRLERQVREGLMRMK